MKDTRSLMGMTVTIEIVDSTSQKDIDTVFEYFNHIDTVFSTYKSNSEISRINRKEIQPKEYSDEMQEILRLCEETKKDTHGYFDINHKGLLDPSGIVKGWAIYQAQEMLEKKGYVNFYINAGGDVAAMGKNEAGEKWSVGIKNPFNEKEIVKIVRLTDKGIATSGAYIRGQHIYDPFFPLKKLQDIVSVTIIADTVYEADRYATAVFAMQKKGAFFLSSQKNLAGYMIDKDGIATYTNNFTTYL